MTDLNSKKQKLSEAKPTTSVIDQDDIFRDLDEKLARQKTLAAKVSDIAEYPWLHLMSLSRIQQ